MYGIRKRQRRYCDVFKQDRVVVDELLGQLLLITTNAEDADVDIMQYVTGNKPVLGKSWEGAKAVYFPLNINGQHWVAVKLDLLRKEVVVFDCSYGCFTDEWMTNYTKPMRKLVPIVLKKSGYFNEIIEDVNIEWPFSRPRGIPQNQASGDCGIFAIKHIEFDMQGWPFDAITDDAMIFFRAKLAVEIYHNDWIP